MQVTQIATEIDVVGGAEGAAVPLSDRMSQALANGYVSAGNDLASI